MHAVGIALQLEPRGELRVDAAVLEVHELRMEADMVLHPAHEAVVCDELVADHAALGHLFFHVNSKDKRLTLSSFHVRVWDKAGHGVRLRKARDMAHDNDEIMENEETQLEPELSEEPELLEIDLPEDVQKVLFYSIDEATKKIDDGEELVPFTSVLAGEDLFMDYHPVDEIDACFASARQAINTIAHIADAYVFCYDGYIEIEDDEHDMLIAEIGLKGEEQGIAYGLLYEIEASDDDDDSVVTFDEGLLLLGECDNLFDPDAVSAAEALQESYASYDQDDEEDDEDGEDE